MPAAEFYEWMTFSQMEPIGDQRGDFNSAMIVATLANIHRDPHSQPRSAAEFMPDWDQRPKVVEQQSVEEQMKIFEFIRITQNAIVESNAGRN